MSSSYFESARTWYSNLYFDSYYSRFFYFFLLIINLFSLFLAVIVYNDTPTGIEKLYMVAKLSVADEDAISLKPRHYLGDENLNILRFGIEESIKIIESFKYDPNFLETINEKNKTLENIFNEEALSKYRDINDEYNPDSDLYCAERGISKEIIIQEVLFLDEKNKNIFYNLKYKIFGIKSIDHVSALVSIYNDATGEEKRYNISLKYEAKIPKNNKTDELYFRITEYIKEEYTDQNIS